ncbi:hypothetical protein GDO81_027859, partial [Engystomops pustulosus]
MQDPRWRTPTTAQHPHRTQSHQQLQEKHHPGSLTFGGHRGMSRRSEDEGQSPASGGRAAPGDQRCRPVIESPIYLYYKSVIAGGAGGARGAGG